MAERTQAQRRATGALTEAEYRALARFRFALRVFLRFSRDAARAAGLTPDQHQLLLAIRGSASGAPTISDLAESLQIRHHSAGELIDRAVEAGLLARTADPDDARLRRLVLTAHGSDILESLSAVHRDELKRFHDELAPILNELGE
jgi:DNA-binding MarR family transcriptional regulator